MFYHGSSINQKIDRTLWVEQHQIDKGGQKSATETHISAFFFPCVFSQIFEQVYQREQCAGTPVFRGENGLI
jgi:hypothetical protein